MFALNADASTSEIEMTSRQLPGVPRLAVQCGGVDASATVGTAASHSLISAQMFERVRAHRRRVHTSRQERLTMRTVTCTSVSIPHKIVLHIKIGKYAWNFPFYAVSTPLCVDVILGVNFCMFTGMIIDIPCQTITYHFEQKRFHRAMQQ